MQWYTKGASASRLIAIKIYRTTSGILSRDARTPLNQMLQQSRVAFSQLMKLLPQFPLADIIGKCYCRMRSDHMLYHSVRLRKMIPLVPEGNTCHLYNSSLHDCHAKCFHSISLLPATQPPFTKSRFLLSHASPAMNIPWSRQYFGEVRLVPSRTLQINGYAVFPLHSN